MAEKDNDERGSVSIAVGYLRTVQNIFRMRNRETKWPRSKREEAKRGVGTQARPIPFGERSRNVPDHIERRD